MGDSSCLIHGFSYASAVPNEAKQGTAMHALGESISFGRFMTEPLSWERCSTFSSSHNKYVEEAERYAQPGSVAEKKAFFEAHYRRIAAQRAAAAAAAALLEQENAAKNVAEGSDENAGDDSACHEQRDDFKAPVDSDLKQNLEDGPVNSEDHISIAVLDGRGQNDCMGNQTDDSTEGRPLGELQAENTPLDELDGIENQDGTKQMERPLLEHVHEEMPRALSMKRAAFSTLKPLIQGKQSKVLATPAKPVTAKPHKENNPEISRKSAASSPKPLCSVKEPHKDIFSITKKTGSCGERLAHTRTPSKESKVHATPLRTANVGLSSGFTASVATPQLENHRMRTPGEVPPSGRKTREWQILSAARSSAKSLWSVRDLGKDRVSINKNNENCGRRDAHAQPRSKESRAHATPMKTAKVGASKAVFTSPASTQLESSRIVTPRDFSATGSKSCGPKWHIFSAVSKSYTACRNQLQNSVLSSPFVLRTEERAAMRKQKLEEKFSACQTPKEQPPKAFKEKAGKEFQKLSRGLCFKNGNLPNFQKETQTSRTKKDTTTHCGIASVPPPAKNVGYKMREALKPRRILKEPLIKKNTREMH